jgi:hypothetical protein
VLHEVKSEILQGQNTKYNGTEFKQVHVSFPLTIFYAPKALCDSKTVDFNDVEPSYCQNC